MTQSDVSDMTFSPTQDMIERHLEYVENTISSLIDHWRKTGQLEPDEMPNEKIIGYLNNRLKVTSRPQWISPVHALGVLVSDDDVSELPDTHPKRLDHLDAMRTRSGLTFYEWRRVVSQAIGMSVQQLKWYEPEDAGDTDTAYLYRFFDSNNGLLYIGITNDPSERFEWHEKNSMWWHYADRHEIEPKQSKRQAYRDESKAIQTERPIFNKVASRRDQNDAVRYIMDRSNLEPDTLF